MEPGDEQSKCPAFLCSSISKCKSLSNLVRALASTYSNSVRTAKGAPSGQTDCKRYPPWAEQAEKGCPFLQEGFGTFGWLNGILAPVHSQPCPSVGHDLHNYQGSPVSRTGRQETAFHSASFPSPSSNPGGLLVLLFALMGVNPF